MQTLNTAIRFGSYVAWFALALWAIDVVPPWVPQGIGVLGILACTVRAYLRTCRSR
jgi:hypothetical protein